jgi:hypothetical protein
VRFSVRRLIILTSVVAAATLVAAALGLRTLRPKPGVTEGHFEMLRPGMTRAEVEHLLHGPPRNDLRHTAIVWVPWVTGKRVSAWVEPATPAVDLFVREDLPKGGRSGLKVTPTYNFFPRVAAKGGDQGVWVTRTGLIAADFGRDGRLRSKYFSGVDELVPPSLAGWLASRPGMIRRSLGF